MRGADQKTKSRNRNRRHEKTKEKKKRKEREKREGRPQLRRLSRERGKKALKARRSSGQYRRYRKTEGEESAGGCTDGGESDLEPHDDMGVEALKTWGGNQAVYEQVLEVVRKDSTAGGGMREPIHWDNMNHTDRRAWQRVVKRALNPFAS
jgi:hypothetical protein